jgi:hypothetical protein
VVKMLCPVTAKPNSVTLTFDHQMSEAAFSDLTVLLVFWFDRGVFELRFGLPLFSLEVFFLAPFILGLPLFFIGGLFLAPCILGLSLFFSEIFFLSPLHFGVLFFHRRSFFLAPSFWGCLFFYWRSFFLAPYILELPLFSSDVFS